MDTIQNGETNTHYVEKIDVPSGINAPLSRRELLNIWKQQKLEREQYGIQNVAVTQEPSRRKSRVSKGVTPIRSSISRIEEHPIESGRRDTNNKLSVNRSNSTSKSNNASKPQSRKENIPPENNNVTLQLNNPELSREEKLRLWREAKYGKAKLEKEAKRVPPKVPSKTPKKRVDTVEKIVSTELLRRQLTQIMNCPNDADARAQFDALLYSSEFDAGSVADYWITRARFEESRRNFPEVVRLYEEASNRAAKPIRDVENGLRGFMIRLREDFSKKLEQPSSTRTSLYDPQDFVEENSAPEEAQLIHNLVNTLNRISLLPHEIQPMIDNSTKTDSTSQIVQQIVSEIAEVPVPASVPVPAHVSVPSVPSTLLQPTRINSPLPENLSNSPLAAQMNHQINKFFSSPALQTPSIQLPPVTTTPIQTPVPQPPSSIQKRATSASTLQQTDVSTPAPTEPVSSPAQTSTPIQSTIASVNRRIDALLEGVASQPERVAFPESGIGFESEKPKEEPKEEEESNASSVVVLASIPASKLQHKKLGSSRILTPVRRSTRLSTTNMVPMEHSELSLILEETGYAYSPNVALPANSRSTQVLFQHSPEQLDESPVTKTNTAMLTPSISRYPSTPKESRVVEDEEEEEEEVFVDDEEEVALERRDEEEEEVDNKKSTEHHPVHEPPTMGRYDTLVPILKTPGSKVKSTKKKSVKLVGSEVETSEDGNEKSKNAARRRRKSTPVARKSITVFTPVRRSARLSTPALHLEDEENEDDNANYEPNPYLPDVADYLQTKLEKLKLADD